CIAFLCNSDTMSTFIVQNGRSFEPAEVCKDRRACQRPAFHSQPGCGNQSGIRYSSARAATGHELPFSDVLAPWRTEYPRLLAPASVSAAAKLRGARLSRE